MKKKEHKMVIKISLGLHRKLDEIKHYCRYNLGFRKEFGMILEDIFDNMGKKNIELLYQNKLNNKENNS